MSKEQRTNILDLERSNKAEDTLTIKSTTVADLCDMRHPFIQLVSMDADTTSDTQLQLIKSSAGYTIHDYGTALSVSLYNLSRYTSIKELQTVITEMAKLIVQKGWFSIELIAGTDTMQKLLWLASQEWDFELEGYTPSHQDHNLCEFLQRLASERGITFKKARIRHTRGAS